MGNATKVIGNFFCDIFVGWIFTPSGLAVFGIIGGVIMLGLTIMTESLSAFAPLSYGFAAIVGFASVLLLLRLSLSVRGSVFTTKPTFVHYKMEKGRVNLVDKSNIFGEPNFTLGIINIVKPAVKGNNARNQRRLDKNHPPSFTEQDLKKASISAIFDKPIANKNFHIHLEKIGGACPVRISSNINNRMASVDLDEIANECDFRIWFNEQKK